MRKSVAAPTVHARFLRSPAVLGLLLVVPFALLELVNRSDFAERFPFPLFAFLWALPVAFLTVIASIVQSLRSGMAQAGLLIVRMVLLGLIAWFWISLVIDQMPCFLGVPNCD